MFDRGSGVLLHITSLPSNEGIGDLGLNAYHFVDMLCNSGQKYWQVLPLNPSNADNGESPYFSSSAFAGNPLLISLHSLVDDGLLSKHDIEHNIKFPTNRVDYDAVRSYKYSVLEKACKNWIGSGTDEHYENFCSQQSFWLDDYALFMVIGKRLGTLAWNKWPMMLKSRDVTELTAVASIEADALRQEKFLQYIFFKQWIKLKQYCMSRGITVIGDIPIYVSFESSDVWVNRNLFKLNEDGEPSGVSGVPPDYFSSTGQLWNNPVYSWDALLKTDFKWWIQRMSIMFSRFDIVRIDHFRGLVQYWEIPAGEKTAINGKWNDVPVRNFIDTLIKYFPGFPVIAEDLGIITPDVVEVQSHYGLPGMKVLHFAFGEDNPENPYLPHNYERNCVVYTGTHDNNTTLGWLQNEAGKDEIERLYQYIGGSCSDQEVVWELIRLAQSSVADIAIIPLQDILMLDSASRMNQPAVPQGNWEWRVSQEQLSRIQIQKLAEYSRIYGRSSRIMIN